MPIDLELVLSFSQDLQRAESVRGLVEAARRAVTAATRYRTVWVFAFEDTPQGRWVRVLAASGAAEEIIWQETPRFPVGDDPFLLEIAQAHMPVVVADMATDPRTDKELVARNGQRTTVNVPFLLGGHVVGALGVGSFGEEGIVVPTASELKHLSVFALLLSAAFERVRLVEEKRAADELARRMEAERTTLEAQLRQAQKMEDLAGGIAHDFNNLLMAILGHAELVSTSMSAADPRLESMDVILSAGKRAANLTRNLLVFSRKQIFSPRPITVQSVLVAASALLRPLLREDVTLAVETPEDDIVVKADAGALEQVVLNIVNNARDAMPDGGTLTIRAFEQTIDDALLARHGRGPLGKCAVIAISDTGTGMSPSTLEKIFEPFFTTKDVGKGTGLGLATSYGIVQQLGGHIFAESELGRGTTFYVYLPLSAESVAEELTDSGLRARNGDETILVAEDEALVRDLVVTLLKSRGYRVLEAVDGLDAIEKFRAHSGEIHLVLTDVIMPKRSGREVFDAVRAFAQNTPVIFTSGYAAEVLGQLQEGHFLLTKPVSPREPPPAPRVDPPRARCRARARLTTAIRCEQSVLAHERDTAT